MIISASITSSNVLYLADEIQFIDDNLKNIHIDIEDASLAPNISIGLSITKKICKQSSSYKSIHLCVKDNILWLDEIKKCNPDIVFLETFLEKTKRKEIITAYKSAGIDTGLCISNYELDEIDELLPLCDSFLVVTTSYDDPEQIYRNDYRIVAEKIAEQGKSVWIDGGINSEILNSLSNENTKIKYAVLGREIFSNKDLFLKKHV